MQKGINIKYRKFDGTIINQIMLFSSNENWTITAYDTPEQEGLLTVTVNSMSHGEKFNSTRVISFEIL